MKRKRLAPASILKVLVFCALLSLFAIGLGIRVLSSSLWLALETGRLDIVAQTKLPAESVRMINEDVVEYLNGSDLKPAAQARFTADELRHLTDVRDLWRTIYRLRDTSLVILALIGLIALGGRHSWWDGYLRTLTKSGFVILAALAALALMAVLDFDFLFNGVHGLFFAEGTWTFSGESMLIKLYPERFWVDSLTGLVAILGLVAMVNISLSSYFLVFEKRGG